MEHLKMEEVEEIQLRTPLWCPQTMVSFFINVTLIISFYIKTYKDFGKSCQTYLPEFDDFFLKRLEESS